MISILIFEVLVFSSCYIIKTSESGDYLLPYVGNGYIGMEIDSDYFFLSTVYNGISDSTNPSLLSHRAAIPNIFKNIFYYDSDQFENGTISERVLDLDKGIYSQTRNVLGRSFEEVFFSHRTEKDVLGLRVTQKSSEEEGVCIIFNNSFSTSDFNCEITDEVKQNDQVYSFVSCQTIFTESRVTDIVYLKFLFPKIGSKQCLDFTQTQTFFFLVNKNPGDLEGYMSSGCELYNVHVQDWDSLWNSGIRLITDKSKADVKGGDNINVEDPSSSKIGEIVQSSQYYLLSSLDYDKSYPFSPSPGSISTNWHHGHIFWDSEIFMLPYLLLFYRDFASSILEYRALRNGYAEEKSKNMGYDGSCFPWQSASSGIEVTSSDSMNRLLAQHVSGDISFAMKQWDFVTSGKKRKRLYEMALRPIAEFWCSRVVEKKDSSGGVVYEINNVIGPDEYAVNVNNSVYTNVIAQLALQYASKTGKRLGFLQDYFLWEKWDEVAKNMYIPSPQYDPSTGFTYIPEYDGYDGEEIQQADVILLNFPLMWGGIDSKTAESNLQFYAEKLGDGQGRPAMTWPMYSIQYLKMEDVNQKGKGKLEKGEEYFRDSYEKFVTGPFHVWKEYEDAGREEEGEETQTYHYITGAGGFLQAVLFGYVGIGFDYENRHLLIESPRLVPETYKIEVNNIQFEDTLFNFRYDNDELEFEVVDGNMYICFAARNQMKMLEGETFTHPNLLGSKKYSSEKQVIKIGVSQKCYSPLVPPIITFLIIFACTTCVVCIYTVIACCLLQVENMVCKEKYMKHVCCCFCCWRGGDSAKDGEGDGEGQENIFDVRDHTIQDNGYGQFVDEETAGLRVEGKNGYMSFNEEGEEQEEEDEEEEEEEEGEYEGYEGREGKRETKNFE